MLALLPFYAGLRIAEGVGLDVGDARLSARKESLRVHGKRATLRELPIHPQLRTEGSRISAKVSRSDDDVPGRLAAIEYRLAQIETRLGRIRRTDDASRVRFPCTCSAHRGFRGCF
ncbi:MAG: hypothetical protein ACRDSR_19980 [Pseudonocardiaceae bacterium]